MKGKRKLAMLAMILAIMATSSVAAFAASNEDIIERHGMAHHRLAGDKFLATEISYEAMSAIYAKLTGEELSLENYNKMLEAHKLMQAGDKEAAKAIMEELDIKHPKFKGHKMGKFHHKHQKS